MRQSIRYVLMLAVLLGAPAPAGGKASRPARLTGLIVYWSGSPYPSIWAVRPDGTHNRRILHNQQNAKRPRLSPDRVWVAFDGASPGKAPMTDFDIQVVRVDGTGRQTLTDSDDWDIDAQWSPDGTLLSFTRTVPHPQDCTQSSVWVMRRDGGGAHRVAAGCAARWSPDGTKLVFSSPDAGNLFIADVATGQTHTLLRTRVLVQAAGWSHDGRAVLFTRTSTRTSNDGCVCLINADGTHRRNLGRGFPAGWSPDGSQILYTQAFYSPLFVMNRDGSHKHRVMNLAVSDPDWR